MDFESYSKYLPYSTIDEAWQIYCLSIGAVKIESRGSHTSAPGQDTENHEDFRTLNDYKLLYITAGRGKLWYMEKDYAIEPGTFIVILPGIKHRCVPDRETGWTEYSVVFNGDYPQHLQKMNILSISEPVHAIGRQEKIMSLYSQMIELAKEEAPGFQQLVCMQILQMIVIVRSSLYRQIHDDKTTELIEKVKCVFIENLYNNLDIESLAQSLSINYKSLREIFKNYTGMSPYQYFLQLKINKARELLSQGTYSVKEVSYKLAFQNPYYFSRLFKKKTGSAPSQWNGMHIEDV